MGRSSNLIPNASKSFKPVSDAQNLKLSGRQRRADEKTMDVVASPVTIISDEEEYDIERRKNVFIWIKNFILGGKVSNKQIFRSHLSSSKSINSYCVNKLGLVVAMLCMALMILFSFTLAAYVFNDILR